MNKENIGKYFMDGNGIILITDIHNEHIYDYVACDIDNDGNITETNNRGYITPRELKYYSKF